MDTTSSSGASKARAGDARQRPPSRNVEPDHAPPAPVASPATTRGALAALDPGTRARLLLGMQRQQGNAAVQRLIGDQAPVQRQEADPPALQHPKLSGKDFDDAYQGKLPLRAGDSRRDTVARFQTLLADEFGLRGLMPKTFQRTPTNSNGEADGMWGKETTDALKEFQERHGVRPVDSSAAGHKTLRAMDRDLPSLPPLPPPGPQPPGPAPRPPRPVVDPNPELDTVLDRIENTALMMILRQRDGAQALSRDLTPLDLPARSIGRDIVKEVLRVLTIGAYGVGEQALRLLVEKALKKKAGEGNKENLIKEVDESSDKIFDALVEKLLGWVETEADSREGLVRTRSDLLAKFSDEHLAWVTQAGFEYLPLFQTIGRTELAKRPAEPEIAGPAQQEFAAGERDARNRSGDPRVDRALLLLDAMQVVASQAFKAHYDLARGAWATEQAKASLGVAPGRLFDTALERLHAGVTTGPNPPAGVLQIFLALDGPVERPTEARIDGLSPRVRSKLSGINAGQAKIPMILDARGDGLSMLRVGVTETGRILDLSASEFAKNHFEKRGDGDRRQGVVNLANQILASPLPEIGIAPA